MCITFFFKRKLINDDKKVANDLNNKLFKGDIFNK